MHISQQGMLAETFLLLGEAISITASSRMSTSLLLALVAAV